MFNLIQHFNKKLHSKKFKNRKNITKLLIKKKDLK